MSATASATYFIGDIQGCADQLRELLEKTEALTPDARYLFAGDLVNRGPKSLDSLRLIRELQLAGRAESVLGNHDLHLLAVAHGIRKPHPSDTLQDILQAEDREVLLNWLRQRPLAHLEQGHLLIHAGLFPDWSITQAQCLGAEVSQMLQSDHWLDFLAVMYGNQPDRWSEDLQGAERWRCIINAMTRMRYCHQDGSMDFAIKEGKRAAPDHYQAWFDLPRQSTDQCVVFGHWSTLGLIVEFNLISLDTGCVWGGQLTAVRLHDHHVIQIDCPQQQKPGKNS